MEETAEIARIEPKSRPQRPEVDAGGPDFENKSRLRQRPASAQVIGFERADASGDETVEAANLGELALVHSLTLVSNLWFASFGVGAGAAVEPTAAPPEGRRSPPVDGSARILHRQTTLEPAAIEPIAATP